MSAGRRRLGALVIARFERAFVLGSPRSAAARRIERRLGTNPDRTERHERLARRRHAFRRVRLAAQDRLRRARAMLRRIRRGLAPLRHGAAPVLVRRTSSATAREFLRSRSSGLAPPRDVAPPLPSAAEAPRVRVEPAVASRARRPTLPPSFDRTSLPRGRRLPAALGRPARRLRS